MLEKEEPTLAKPLPHLQRPQAFLGLQRRHGAVVAGLRLHSDVTAAVEAQVALNPLLSAETVRALTPELMPCSTQKPRVPNFVT